MSNTTTIVRGWKLTRVDAQVLAFTDCDVDLTVDGVTYLASSALTPSEAVSSLGLAVDEQEVQGGLSSDAITEKDLASGLYDGAAVQVIEIDWNTETLHAVVGNYYLGEVSRSEVAFSAELRSQAGILAQKRGRYVTPICDADLGDARCKVNVAALKKTGAVTHKSGEADFQVSGLSVGVDESFAGGTLVWTSGANLGQTQEVRAHRGSTVGLWRAPLFDAQVGDTFDILPGCDKSFGTCRARFNNGNNFRGFPAVVGEEAFSYANQGEAGLDGGSRNVF
ncbi:DUF2163 domain-containing protein [Ruegeria atlantica]|uniref:DUF2163 domain-containing protein n=1 Tax=Ruegeria atlantica TaxID=81569 RepID=UPI00147FD772|nr:DUF2163 domain-containing protein [Ruegeria atlantica]